MRALESPSARYGRNVLEPGEHRLQLGQRDSGDRRDVGVVVEPAVDQADEGSAGSTSDADAPVLPGVSVTPPVSRVNVIAGSMVVTSTTFGVSCCLPMKPVIIGSRTASRPTASGAIRAARSSATSTSQPCTACSDSRMPRTPARSMVIRPNITTVNDSRSASLSASTRVISASFAAVDWAACSSGARAFQVSQIGWNASAVGGSAPVTPASIISEKISAPLPRWESTSAMVHSLA